VIIDTALTASGAGIPGGSNTDIQFNANGSFGGNVSLTYNVANATLLATNGDFSGNLAVNDVLFTSNINPGGAVVTIPTISTSTINPGGGPWTSDGVLTALGFITGSQGLQMGGGNIFGPSTTFAYTIGANPAATFVEGGFIQLFGSGAGAALNLGTSNVVWVQINSTGQILINPSSSASPGSPLTINYGGPGGAAVFSGTNGLTLISPGGSGQSFGINNSADTAQYFFVSASTGQVSITNQTTQPALTVIGTINTSSDSRIKKDIQRITDHQNIIASLNGVRFTWKRTDEKSVGLIAQDVLAVLPEAISEDKEGSLSLNYNAIVAVLVEEVKALRQEIEALKAKI
jgi:Chaperone of endosialidase